ncbi:MAG: glycosyltransferase family 1 protein [Pseudomonadota bacterium]
MRILIDMQGAQSESRFRGIGRYSLALALGVARNAGEHEVWLALNGALAPAIADLRRAFDGLVPQDRIRVFDIVTPVAEINSANTARCRAAEMLREHFIEQLAPDVVLVTSLFEGYIDDSVVSAGRFADPGRTAVVLYDLIPFLNPDAYLGTPEQRQHYAGKIASLRAAGLLLAISDYTRQEAIEALGLDPQGVVAISTAVDDSFRPAPPGPELPALRARLGIVRDIIMYAPGGFDARKNIDGLIVAYSLLPATLRARHQLVIASKLGEHERRVMTEHARHHRLGPDELVLTGYVSDTELVELYRSAALFVFPSKHEGFGLPALEAMACGALVIGANNTSIPEVIGCEEALFDAASPQSIADKIALVLGDPAVQARLREHGRAQAARFSWDVTAQKALRALAAHHARPAPAPAAAGAPRRKLAFVSPLPPLATASAAQALRLLPALAERFDIDLVADQDEVVLPPALAALPRRSAQWFAQHAGSYDQVLYQFGNDPAHHYLFALAAQHPGVVVLRDFFLGEALLAAGDDGDGWADALYEAHGYQAVAAAMAEGPDAAARSYPCNLGALEGAHWVIADAPATCELAQRWYGAQATANWSLVEPGPDAGDEARRYAEILDRAALRARSGRPALLRALADIPGLSHSEAYLRELALCLAGMPDPLRQRQLLVDVTPIAAGTADAATASLRRQLPALLQLSVPGLRVEPVLRSQQGGQWHVRYARALTRGLLGMPGSAPDAAVDIGPYDLYYGADEPGAIAQAAAEGLYARMRERGVRVGLRVGALPGADDAGLAAACAHADVLLCVSDAVKAGLDDWMARQPQAAQPASVVLEDGGGDASALPSPEHAALLLALLGTPGR